MKMTDHHTDARKLELKRLAALERLGTRWILHPANRVKRLPKPLGFPRHPLT